MTLSMVLLDNVTNDSIAQHIIIIFSFPQYPITFIQTILFKNVFVKSDYRTLNGPLWIRQYVNTETNKLIIYFSDFEQKIM